MTLSGDRFNIVRRLLRFSSYLLLFLLPLNSFAKAHLWKLRPFRATDTEHSGGDHICDLRRDGDGNGRPDRLGDCVRLSGTVIAEPSTFETGGWIFWIRDHTCGVMVYGEPEDLSVGDYVDVRGWLRVTNGSYFFPETGLATLGDVAVENGGTILRGKRDNQQPVVIAAEEFCSNREMYSGNLVTIGGLSVTSPASSEGGNLFFRLHNGSDSIIVYLDEDTGCSLEHEPGTSITITGMVIRMRTPSRFADSPSWCIAPRWVDDIESETRYSNVARRMWGEIKLGFFNQD